MDIQYIIDSYQDFPFLIRFAWAISAIMCALIVILSLYLKVIRSYLRTRDKETLKFKKDYEALLIEYLYSGNDTKTLSETQQSIILKLKADVPNKSKRKIIIAMLYNLMNEVSGEMSVSIKTLYYETELINYAIEQLQNKNWYIKAKGIGELTRFKIEEVYRDISFFINHPRKEVRKETHLYLVTLFRFEGLTFLNELETTLSEWDQIQLLEVLQKIDDQQICDIKPWLLSSNKSVVLFALKLAKIYNQYEVQDVLMELLSHKNKEVRICSIEVLTDLYGIEAKEMLKSNFNKLSTEEQVSFFQMMEKLVIPSDEPFLEKHLFHKNFEIQLLALKILKTINIDKYMGVSVSQTKEEEEEPILKLANNI